MILTCPDCATRYFVDDRRLGPMGRTVRCASCGSSWRARVEDETPLELGAATEERVAASGLDSEPLSFKPVDPQDLPAPELPKAFRAKQEQKRRVRRMAAAGAIWAGLAMGFAGLLFCAWVFRVDVARLVPQAASAYALVRVNATGLQIEGVKAQPAADDPHQVVVKGELRNVVSQTAAVPLLRVTLLDKKGVRMRQRVIELSRDWVAPGQAVPFKTVLSDPGGSAADVDVAFALDMAPPPRPLRRTLAIAPAPQPVSPPPPAATTPAPQPAAPVLRPPLGVPPAAAAASAPASLHGLDSAPGERVSPSPHG